MWQVERVGGDTGVKTCRLGGGTMHTSEGSKCAKQREQEGASRVPSCPMPSKKAGTECGGGR
jgi:hypothetical protein